MWADDYLMADIYAKLKYKKGDKLIVLYTDNENWILRRIFKRAIENNNIKLLKKRDIPIKTVLSTSLDTVEFTDGSIYWSSQVCKKSELYDFLHRKREEFLKIKENESLKKEEIKKGGLMSKIKDMIKKTRI